MGYRIIIGVAATLALGGCASVLNGLTQPVMLQTVSQEGVPLPGARCTLRNDDAVLEAVSGQMVRVHRSVSDLHVSCTLAGQGEARLQAVSRSTRAIGGNLIAGGGIGALVDHARGSAYAYPATLQLVFGRTELVDAQDFARRVAAAAPAPVATRN